MVSETFTLKTEAKPLSNRSRMMVVVESEAIAALDYDEQRSIMFVRFVAGDWYSYSGVSAETFAEFVDAESHGRFFHERILHRYPYTRVGPDLTG